MGPDRVWIVHRFESVASTMNQAALLARFGARERTAVISSEQTAGRGRDGRTWQAPKGTALFCTLIVRPGVSPGRLSTLPLVTGVAVAQALEAVSGERPRLKWPNDVWLGSDPENRKVAGILVTSSLRGAKVDYVLVGIGINVSTQPKELPPGATSLSIASGCDTQPDELFRVVLERFDRGYAEFLAANGRPSLDAWRARAALIGESVTIEDAGRTFTGTFLDVDANGALVLEQPGSGVRRIMAGDLVRGPTARR